ncbi:lysozyme [Sphingomonas sp.]|jgi:lysozyme|uniref:lysozyme n=1 Tax=Sphingomonas sp. TaxID=28214 RepID=UPI0035614FD4
MRISQDGVDLVKHFESCALVAYPDPKTKADPWTVGWGATGKDIERGTHWTQYQADQRLENDLLERERQVSAAVTIPLTQWQFDAMVSIVFNVGSGSTKRDGILRLKAGGPSTLLRKLNAGDIQGASAEFIRWISPGSAVENGLRRRRVAETALFNGKDWRKAIA